MDKRHLLTIKHRPPDIRHKIMPAMIATMILVTVASEAKVYLRWGAAGNIARFVAAIGGKRAYKAEMTVNGKNTTISVYGIPESNRAWGNSVRSVAYNVGDTFTSLTAVTLPGAHLLFQYHRQIANHTAQKDPLLLPRFPQSTHAFYAHNEKADLYISVSRSSAAPAQVRNFYHGKMRENGWHMPAPANAATPEGMSVFIREQEVACIGVERVNDNTETRITVLHKQLKMK